MPLPPLLPRLSPTPPPLRAGGRGNAALLSPGRRRRPALLAVVRAKRKDEASFTDRILDYIEGGPKLRRWYGAPDLLPKDGGAEDEEDESQVDIEEPRDAVLVTNGDSEMVILALILKRARTKALVKDKRTTEEAFGTYVEDGFFSELTDLKGVQHIVLLSQLAVYRNSGGLQAIMNSKLKKLAERDEEVVLASGIPCTIIRTGSLQSTPGGERGFDFTEGIATKGRISKEDAATICVEALDSIPRKTLIFEVANGDEKVRDWKAWFAEQIKREEEIQ
ncbi:sanguinarine reductase-like isoform X6 [Miscanthus floridulus]|uniref:sanguinarine reductase-like isoform X6 n=1 Tax=Miscanthus floridulus TaxID=154761 RepID=UPI003459CC56